MTSLSPDVATLLSMLFSFHFCLLEYNRSYPGLQHFPIAPVAPVGPTCPLGPDGPPGPVTPLAPVGPGTPERK